MDRKSSPFFHIMSCAKLKSAGLVLYFGGCVFVRKLDLAPCLFPFSFFLWVDRLLWLSVIFEHKGAHLKRLNANLISYMKQSWFIFPELFFLSLQTTSQRTPRTPPNTHPSLLESRLSTSSQRNGEVLCGRLPRSSSTLHPPTPFPFPPVDICPQQVPRRAQR